MDNEVAAFWDDFAAEYYQIQQESQVSIVTDVVAFLQDRRLLPVETVADLGGGSGRYLPPLVQTVRHRLSTSRRKCLVYNKKLNSMYQTNSCLSTAVCGDFMAQTPQKL